MKRGRVKSEASSHLSTEALRWIVNPVCGIVKYAHKEGGSLLSSKTQMGRMFIWVAMVSVVWQLAGILKKELPPVFCEFGLAST